VFREWTKKLALKKAETKYSFVDCQIGLMSLFELELFCPLSALRIVILSTQVHFELDTDVFNFNSLFMICDIVEGMILVF